MYPNAFVNYGLNIILQNRILDCPSFCDKNEVASGVMSEEQIFTKMEERILNEKDSYELIQRMILNSQRRLEKEHALPFLIFGYLTILSSLSVWLLLKQTGNPMWNFLWLSIPLLGYVVLVLMRRKNRPMVRTFIDKAVDSVWLVCGITVLVASFAPVIDHAMPILFVVALLMSVATTITGGITRVRLLVVSGSLGILLSLAQLSVAGLNSILFFAVNFLLMMVIPGHILYAKGRKQ